MRSAAASVILALFLVLGMAEARSQVEEKRIALVIGNGAYTDLPPLRNPPADAELIGGTLRELGFEVSELVDADREAMMRAIQDFGVRLEEAGPDAVGLFYYAGHGIQAQGSNFLIPLDVEIRREPDLEINAVDVDWVLAQVEAAENRMNILILDACRDNPLSRSIRSATRGLMRIDAPRGTLVAYATAPGDVAYDGTGTNSPYSEALAAAMMEPDVVLESVFRKVRVQVMQATGEQQVPWENSSLIGEFYFKRAEPADTVEAAAAGDPPTAGAEARDNRSAELLFWASIKDLNRPELFEDYLRRFPDGIFSTIARIRLQASGVAEGGGATTPSSASVFEPPPAGTSPAGPVTVAARNDAPAGATAAALADRVLAARPEPQPPAPSTSDAGPEPEPGGPQSAAVTPGLRKIDPAVAAAASIDFGRYHALVIGNDDYQRLPDLETAVADAEALAAILAETYGFEVEVLRDADRYQILSALNDLRASLTEDDNLLVYYAGHVEVDAGGQWLPVDAEAGDDANWISFVTLTDMLDAMRARHVLLLTDGHFELVVPGKAPEAAPSLTGGARVTELKTMVRKRSRTVLTSGFPPLDGGEGRHSPFAAALLEVLAANREAIDGRRLHQTVLARLPDGVKQALEELPQYAPVADAGHEGGDFVFVPRL